MTSGHSSASSTRRVYCAPMTRQMNNANSALSTSNRITPSQVHRRRGALHGAADVALLAAPHAPAHTPRHERTHHHFRLRVPCSFLAHDSTAAAALRAARRVARSLLLGCSSSLAPSLMARSASAPSSYDALFRKLKLHNVDTYLCLSVVCKVSSRPVRRYSE